MKRKRVKKVEEIKQEEITQEEVNVDITQEQPQIHQKRSPWDDLVFMGPRPVSAPIPEAAATEGTEVAEETTNEKPVEKTKRQGWSWI
ncbi:hypothetical protein RJD24_14755 [Bacillaceae bacterium IKA-2]|nr:hypothetical protein RJD24_14755 [Bacillaceae bacterium IKA-2]